MLTITGSPAEFLDLLIGVSGFSAKLDQILQGQKRIMATQEQAIAALAQIDAATTKQAAALQAEGDSLQTVADEMKSLAAQVKALGGSQALFDGLVAQAEKVSAIGTTIDAHGEFSKKIAADGGTSPLPELPVVTATSGGPEAPVPTV
jgi:methyl-accepting chemotaxis protein